MRLMCGAFPAFIPVASLTYDEEQLNIDEAL
jgi:hypothetical protein